MRTVAEFKIPYYQFLDSDSRPTDSLPAFARQPEELVKMYTAMVQARAFDSKAVNLQRTGKLGTYASCLGQEATHVGVAAALQPEDCLAPVYREVGTQLWRGVSMLEILLYWGGDERGNDFAGPRHDFPWCVPIATQTLHAAGAAMAFKYRRERRCALAYIGDGGTSEGTFYEAINLAGVNRLPVVFVIVNNRWAISVPIEQQTAAETLAQKAIAAGMPGVQVDGNDVIAVREIVAQATERARSGGGPTVVEALTYRLSDHTTADDASRYRDAARVEEARHHEPIPRLQKYLRSLGLWNDERENALKGECGAEVEAAVAAYTQAPRPEIGAMFDHLFATVPENLAGQLHSAHHFAGSGSH